LVEEVEVTILSKHRRRRSPEIAGDGQVAAAAIQIASELERERGERVRAGLGRLTDPDPSRLA
jgi:hypothetical protein